MVKLAHFDGEGDFGDHADGHGGGVEGFELAIGFDDDGGAVARVDVGKKAVAIDGGIEDGGIFAVGAPGGEEIVDATEDVGKVSGAGH